MALPVISRANGNKTAAITLLARDPSLTSDKKVTITAEELVASVQVVNPDTTHAIPIANGTVIMTKGSASAFTLAAPTVAQNGTRMRFISNSAYAHVITATGLLQDGVTGGGKNTATFGAFKGAALELEAYNDGTNGYWYVANKNVCTIA